MNMFVLCPPFRELEGTTKEGEVVLFLDVYLFFITFVERTFSSKIHVDEMIGGKETKLMWSRF
jgi:hypothetical protein